jgi:hypothetical protein
MNYYIVKTLKYGSVKLSKAVREYSAPGNSKAAIVPGYKRRLFTQDVTSNIV